jgi:hypothetical protein
MPYEHINSTTAKILKSNSSLLNNRAILYACAASGATINIDGACPFINFDFKISGLAFYRFKISICDQLNIQVPADLDQFG